MNILLTVFYAGDLYEAVIKDNAIVRITKYYGTSQLSKEVRFESLPTQVKQSLVDKYLKRNQDQEDD